MRVPDVAEKQLPPRSTIAVLAGYGPSLVNFRGKLLEAMVRAGHQVVAFAPDIDQRTAQALNLMGVTYRTIPMHRASVSPFGDLRTVFALTRAFESLEPEVVLAYTMKPVVYGSLAANRAGVPRIYSMITGLGYAFSGDSWRQRLARGPLILLLRRALRSNRCVFFQNQDDVNAFREHGLLNSEACAVVVAGSGVDLDHFTASPPPSGGVTFLLMTRLLRDKGVDEYVKAAEHVRSRHPDATFRILGPLGSNPNSVTREEVQAWVKEGVIEYLGVAHDVRPHLAAASVVVLPSYYREGMPRSLLEAMATGRAIVTTDSPGCRETVIDGRNGFLVPSRDALRLAEALERFLGSTDLIVRMGAEGRRLAEAQYDVHRINATLLNEMGFQGAIP